MFQEIHEEDEKSEDSFTPVKEQKDVNVKRASVNYAYPRKSTLK